MAQKLSVQIELAGAAEIARQLESLGETGKQAFEEMGAAAEKVGGFSQLDPTEVTQKLQDMGITGVDAINQIQDAVQQAGNLEGIVQGVKALENGFGALGKVMRPLGGEIRKVQQAASAVYAVLGPIGAAGVGAFAAITTAVTAAANSTIAFATSINKVNDEAIRLGVGVEGLDRFRAGLEQAGVSAESVASILQSKLASEQGLQGLEAFIQSLARMPDTAARSKAAVEQFGQAGAELIRILQAGGRLTGFGGTQGLINAEDAQKATQLTQAINQLGSAVDRLNTLGFAPALTVGINAVTSAVQVLGARLQETPWTTFLNAANLGLNPITSLISTINGALTFLGGKVQQTGQQVQQTGVAFTAWGTVATQSGQQATVAVQGAGAAAEQTGVMFTSFGTVAQQAGQKAATAGQQGASAWERFNTAGDAAIVKIAQVANSIASIVWTNISSIGVAAWNGLSGAIQGAMEWLQKYLGLQSSVQPLAGGAPIGQGGIGSNAGGGLLGGRGTGTSDSNLAWVSRGEHIMPAHAVRQPGVLAFLEALRRSGGDLSRILDGMGRFALGGMVPRAVPAFAAGGRAGGGSNVTIQFPGLPAIGGLRASSEVVDELRKAAALAQVRSGGRKPSRYS